SLPTRAWCWCSPAPASSTTRRHCRRPLTSPAPTMTWWPPCAAPSASDLPRCGSIGPLPSAARSQEAGLMAIESGKTRNVGVDGVQVQTEKVWKFAKEYELRRAIVVNRLDRERADFFRTLDSLTRRLKGRIVPLHLPVGEEAGFKGYVDLAKMKAFLYADGRSSETEVPADLAERAKEWREKLVEAAAETDDDLLTKYLEEGAL